MQCVLEVTRLYDGDNRAEYLFVEALHILCDVGENVWPHVYALAGITVEILRLVAIGYSTLSPYLRRPASLTHFNPLQKINRISL